ncbi:hypothetical protein ABQE44_16620 [Mycolicibacterium sp. XJ2546]
MGRRAGKRRTATGVRQAVDAYTAGPVDLASMAGPSTRPRGVDDPIWQPISGISLQDYARLVREAQARGVFDQAGMINLATARGWNPLATKAALDGWSIRIGQSVEVGQQFRSFLGC